MIERKIHYTPLFLVLTFLLLGMSDIALAGDDAYRAILKGGGLIGAKDLGLQMVWWKWVLVSLWYVLLSFSFAGSFTFLGEKEPGAWGKFLGFHLIVTVIFGVMVWFLI